MTNAKNVILSARDIVVEFDVRDRVLTAIRNVSLDLVEGEVMALVGESGSGKSVLTKTFTGMLEDNGRIANGNINYRGQELTELKSNKDWEDIRGAKIATIFQDRLKQLDHKIRKLLLNTKAKVPKKPEKWPLIIWKRWESQKRNVALMNILSNIQAGCANGSLLLLRLLVAQIS